MEHFEELRQQVLACRRCEAIFGFEPRPRLQGNAYSKIIQISQAPSKKVYETGIPFNDASGNKLKQQWYGISDEIFYDPNYFCLCSVGLCYPGKNKSGTDRLPPAICAKTWLQRIIDAVDNQLFILVGSYAAKTFFKGESFADLIFSDQKIGMVDTLVLPHPSPLNIKWFKDHPDFYTQRLPEIRDKVQKILIRK